MSIDFMRPEVDELRPRISVIGVGGAGGNAIAYMMRADVQGVDFVVANTDAQALNASLADLKNKGARLIDETPRVGAGGCLVAFVHPSTTNGVLLELVQHR